MTGPLFEAHQAAATPDERARDEGALTVRSAVVRMAQAAGTEVQERPAWPGARSTLLYAAPADGIRYALMLRSQAAQQIDEYIRRAREDGLTWRQIGEILDPALWSAGADADLGVNAYEYAAGAGRFATLSFYWECPACGGNISDRGPYESHPEDNEQGHGPGCGRFAAEVAAHDARIAEWDG